jgi:glyoxylase-like metal-dependent hydrolase (beta-lactamase superfamily II)
MLAHNADPAVRAAWLNDMFLPPDVLEWALNVVVVRSGGRTILIDAGLGVDPNLNLPRAGRLALRLEAAGRWIAFGHFEADECGAMNEWLAVAPQATPAHGQTGCMVSLNDFADRAPHVMADNEVIELAASAFASSIRHIRLMDGMPGCCTRRRHARCYAATSSPSSETSVR